MTPDIAFILGWVVGAIAGAGASYLIMDSVIRKAANDIHK
jgi:hypothetical protein